nr:MAG TPA: hypothetical protein [Caudoviricetes sp.]
MLNHPCFIISVSFDKDILGILTITCLFSAFTFTFINSSS